MMVFFVWGAVIFFQERTPPQDAAEVYTVAKQWMWKFEHKGGQREINELHVPVGRDVKMIMTSQDVIHSFFVPAFRLKQDVVPGRYTTLWFRATKAGHLPPVLFPVLRNAALRNDRLGSGHGTARLRSLDERRRGNQPLAVTGEKLFTELGCVTCHRSDTQGRGPNLVGVFGKPVLLEDGRTVTADENYIRESILEPAAKIVQRFQARHADFPGAGQRRATECVGRLREIAGRAAVGTARQCQTAWPRRLRNRSRKCKEKCR